MIRSNKHARPDDHDNPELKRRAFQCETSREGQSPENGKDDTQSCVQSMESDDLHWNGEGAKSNDPAPFGSIPKSDSVSRESDKTGINDRDSRDIQPDNIQEKDHTDRENSNSESGDTDSDDTDGYDTDLDDVDCRIDTPRPFSSPEQLEVAQAIFPNVFNKVQRIIQSAKCGPLPANIIPPQKRIRIEGSPDSTTNDRVEMYYLFACPFYRHDPARYEECMNRHILESIKNVQQHLQKSHIEPPYCPICRTEFTGASIRDNHTRERSCELRERYIDGLNSGSRRKLCDKKKDHIEDGEEKRWHRMWKIAFPNLPAPRPYLDVGAGLWISIGFEYWSERGFLLVSEELRRLEHDLTPNHNLEVLKNSPEAAALHNNILSWILNELWDQRHFPEPRPLSLDD